MTTKREGVVRTYQHHNNRLATLVEASSDTDFVAMNKEFLSFVDQLNLHIASEAPSSVEELLEQTWLFGESQTVGEVLLETRKKFGEDIQVVSFMRWSMDPPDLSKGEQSTSEIEE